MATFTVTTDTVLSTLGDTTDDTINIQEGAILTIDASTYDIKDISAQTIGGVVVTNTSTTTPIFVNLGSTTTSNVRFRFEGAGNADIQGDKILLGVTDGTSHQVFTLPTGLHGDGSVEKYDYLGGIWVDHSESFRDAETFMRTYARVEDITDWVSEERVGSVFTHDPVANTITMGGTTGGATPPSGLNVYIPNIQIRKGPSNAGGTPNLDLNPSGQFVSLWCSISKGFGGNLASGSLTSLEYTSCDFGNGISPNNQIQRGLAKNCALLSDVIGLSVTGCSAGFDIKNCYCATAGGNNNAITTADSGNVYIEKTVAIRVDKATTESSKGCFFIGSSDTEVYDSWAFGGANGINTNVGASNVTVDNVLVNASCYSTGQILTETIGILKTQDTNGVTVTNLNSYLISNGGTAHNTYAFNFTLVSQNVTISGCTIDVGTAVNSLIYDSGFNNRVNDITVHGAFTSRLVTLTATALNPFISNIKLLDTQTSGSSTHYGNGLVYNGVGTTETGTNSSSTALGTGANCISSYMFSNDPTRTIGRYLLRFAPVSDNYPDYYTETVKTGLMLYNNNGKYYIQNLNDVAEFEGRVAGGVLGVTALNTKGTSSSNFSVEYACRRPNGTYSSYVSTASNLDTEVKALAADPNNEVQFKFKITKNSAGLSQDLYAVVITTDNDPNYMFPFVVTPPTTTTIAFPNIIDGSRFIVRNVTQATVLSNALVSGGSGISEVYTVGVEYNAGDIGSYAITYQSGTGAKELIEGEFTFPSTTSVISNPVAQLDQPNYVLHGVDGSAVAGITWDSGNLQFDISDTDNVIDGKDIAAWYYYYITTATGIDEVAGAIEWNEINKVVNCVDCVGITFDNTKASPLRITDTWLSRDDDASIIAATSNSIQIDPPAVFAVETGVSGLTAAESTELFKNTDILADTNELQTNQGDWATATGFSTFDPTTDAVANVTLVGTCTTNTDMRGTDGANTVAPDNASITAILADTNELQLNQGNWLTADVSSLATSASIAALNDFNPTTDTVANVTLVGTCTTNTDMRGTDGANTVAPDNASITAILADTNELQLNQGNWLTATGFTVPGDLAPLATEANATTNKNAIITQGDLAWTTATGFSTFNPATDAVANVTLVGTCTTNTDMRGTDGANTVAPDNATISSTGTIVSNMKRVDESTGNVVGTVLNISKGV